MVVSLWTKFCDGAVVFLWWRRCFCVFVVVSLFLCFCDGVVVFLWWCSCVFGVGVGVVVFLF